MKTLKEKSAHLIFCVAAGALSCGRNLPMESEAGGAAGTGGGGSSSCPNLDVNRIAACWDGPLGEDRVVSDLRFVRTVEPDESYCVHGFPNTVGKTNFSYPTGPFVAWEFEDSVGDRLVVQFAVPGLMPDAVRAGDVVDFNATTSFGIHSGAAGAVWLESAGAPVVGFFLHWMREFQDVPDLAIESDHAMCADEEGTYCWVARAMRVRANGELGVVPVGQSGIIGGLTIFNASYFDNRDCESEAPGESQVYRPHFEMGLYTAREPEE